MMNRKVSSPFTLSALLCGMLTMAFSTAHAQDQNIICLGQYALCSSALCQPDEDGDGMVNCACEGPLEGLNLGAKSSCQQRGNELISTFSLWDLTATRSKPAKSVLVCEGEHQNAWAFCLDSPCRIVDGEVICSCTLAEKSDYYTFAGNCETEQACQKLWSAAALPDLLGGYSALWEFEADIPKLQYCP